MTIPQDQTAVSLQDALLEYYRATTSYQYTLGHEDATADGEKKAEERLERATATVRAALAHPQQPSGWRDIASAPKDGTEIWAYNGEQARMRWSEGDEWALWVWSDDLLADADPSPDQPTHWQPLPPPPVVCPTCGGDGKETCTNPDHGFIDAMSWHDIGRIGCPACGHDPHHKIHNGGACEDCNGTGYVLAHPAEQQEVDIRKAIQLMAGVLKDGAWAEILSRDPDVAGLEAEISRLVGEKQEGGAAKSLKSLPEELADALRPFLCKGQKVIWRMPFRWHDDNGLMRHHYDGMSLRSLAADFDYEIIVDAGEAGIIAPARAAMTGGSNG